MSASRTICLTAAIAAITPNAEKTTIMVMFSQKTRLLLDGLNVKLKKTTGMMKSKGMNPNAPINELMSLKNGNIVAITVEMTTDNDLAINLGMKFRAENSSLEGSESVCSKTSFVGCR